MAYYGIFSLINVSKEGAIMKIKKPNFLIYFICISIIFIVSISAFTFYTNRLNKSFANIETQNFRAFGETRYQEIIAKIDNVKATVSVAASAISLDIDAFTSEEIATIMDSAQAQTDSFYMDYFALQSLDTALMSKKDQLLIEQIKNGESVVSDVAYDDTYEDNKNFFGVASPVYKGEEVVGFVRALVPSSILITSEQTGFLRDSMGGYLLYSDGTLVNTLSEKNNFLTSLIPYGADEKTIHRILDDMEKGKSAVRSIKMEDTKTYMYYTPLPYNNWYMVSTMEESELSAYRGDLRDLSLQLIVAIVAIAIVVGTLFILYMNRKERKIKMETERFSLLVNFTDTILCKYIYREDVLLFTPNSVEVLALDNITIENFMKEHRGLEIIHPDDLEIIRKVVFDHSNPTDKMNLEIRLKTKDDNYLWFDIQLEFIYHKKELDSIIAKLTDNSENKLKLDNLKEKASYDGLTGLFRYPILKEQVEMEIEKQTLGALCILDCDRFKQINDTYGHAVGDRCLVVLAECLQKQVIKNNLVGRYGGDEFIMYIINEEDLMNIEAFLQGLIGTINQIEISDYPQIKLSSSIGVAFYHENTSYEEMFEEADKCLYQAKKDALKKYSIKR
ncbi:MAG: diguanylate cyclase [Erysipelotrichia bacterium]|nr:diguanylate cyclase [Erysipelotrichia bacterium]NCC54508.1 diguanylate cyclase [Erysipelotrichia bacterium]